VDLVQVPVTQFYSRYLETEVECGGFRVGRFPVTVRQFERFVQATGYRTTAEAEGSSYVYDGERWRRVAGACWRTAWYRGEQTGDHPVVQVSRRDAEAFCSWSGGRLPQPQEWELAASGGYRRRFPWGDDEQSLGSCLCGQDRFLTRSVYEAGAVTASPFGCLEMLGNVWEWSGAESRNHPGCGVFMGGGWSDPATTLSCWCSHDDDPPTFTVDDVGFRLVMP
jgi:formylglycine-generating enzyme required for sulfatase activity